MKASTHAALRKELVLKVNRATKWCLQAKSRYKTHIHHLSHWSRSWQESNSGLPDSWAPAGKDKKGTYPSMEKATRSLDVPEKQPIVLTYIEFQTEVCFWCLFLFRCMTSVWPLNDVLFGCSAQLSISVGSWQLKNHVVRGALPIHLLRHFCCRKYCSVTMHSITDRQTTI